MKKSVIIGALAASTMLAGAANAATLDDVKARGELNCGVNVGLTGFGMADANGTWVGFDVDLCRAVAAAVLGDPTKVKFVPTTGETRFTALSSGEIDLLVRNSTWTFSRDNDHQLDFVVQVLGARRIGQFRPALLHRMGGFQEIERRLAVDLVPHFGGMGGIVAPDAKNPADGKPFGPADHRQRHHGWRREQIFAHVNGDATSIT